MLTVPQFYAQTRWGDEWNVLRANGKRHRGHDIKAPRGQVVPALNAGTVHAIGYSSVLGYYVVVRLTAFTYEFYCHLIVGTRPKVGTVLKQGQSVGQVAGPDDDPGSAWSGPHLHYGAGPASFSVTTGPTYDATKRVSTVLTQFASGQIIPLPTEEENVMDDYRFIYTKAAPVRWALMHPTLVPDGVQVTSSQGDANAIAAALGFGAELVADAASFDVAVAGAKRLAALASAARPAAAGSADLSPVVKAVEAVGAKIDALPTVFTVSPA